MRIKDKHIPYIANKIALEMSAAPFIKLSDSLEKLNFRAQKILEDDLNKEKALDERVREILQEREDEIEFMQIDRPNMFWRVKRELAGEFGVIFNTEDRHNALAHSILNDFVNENLINFDVSENRVKNLIFSAIEDYLKSYEQIEEIVLEKMENRKRKVVRGSEEWDLVFEKLYQEELKRKGML